MITVLYDMAWTLVTNANEPQVAECNIMMRGLHCTFGPSKTLFYGVSDLKMKRFFLSAIHGFNAIRLVGCGGPMHHLYHQVKTKIKLLTKCPCKRATWE